eukprot:GILI01021467.1.p1 GENE.GILI01021467.1~~GILI01021467.1.p1  ORF type:complete len:769 (+),score=79.06 GILI01021467.1:178-2307(+)
MSGQKLRAATRVMDRANRMILQNHFKAWRYYFRKQRIEDFSIAIREKRKASYARKQHLGLAFANWRWVVEHGRTVFLQERLHDNSFLLDNAKNQFQMQCFRSDRYLHTVEELRTDLQNMRENRDTFRAEARALEKALRDHRIISRDEKNDIANTLLRTLSEWKHLATVTITRRHVPPSLLQLEELVSTIALKKAASSVQSIGDELADEDTVANTVAEGACLEWVNGILRASSISTVMAVNNYGDDFANGEVLLLLMNEIYPADVPIAPLQEANLMKRLDRISELASTVGLAHFPQATDLVEKVSDRIFMAVAELFIKHTQRLMTAVVPVATPPQCLIRYDAGMVKSALGDVQQSLEDLIGAEDEIVNGIGRVESLTKTISNYASFLTRERLAGHPVSLVDQKEVNRFCRLKQGRFKDLEFKYRNASVEWLEQINRLRVLIRKSFPLMKRVFSSYAGNSLSVSEPNFWRFVGDIGVIDKQLLRVAVERIFIIANREDDDVADEYESDELDEENPITELIPSEFTECLVRIADQRMISRTIYERVEGFISTYLKPLGLRQEDANRFRRDVYEPPVQAIWAKYQKELAKIFLHFAKLSSVKGPTQKTQTKFIGLPDLLLICKDGGALQGNVDESTVAVVARNVVGEEISEIPLHAFMECLGGLAAYRVPSPFIPLDKKVDHVLSHLLATLRVKLRGTLTIADFKLVPLPAQK